MKKINFTMHFSVMQQSLDRVFKDMLAFQKEHLQELFVRNDTVTVELLTESRNNQKTAWSTLKTKAIR